MTLIDETRAEAAAGADLLTSLNAALGTTTGSGVVDASSRRRAEYTTDASNYRVVPQVVVFPRTVEDVDL